MKLDALLLLLTVSLTRTQAAKEKVVELDNRLAFEALCNIARLAHSQTGLENEPNDVEAAYTQLQALNMTLADDQWKKKFKTEGDGNTWITKIPEEHKSDKAWIKYWQAWKAAAMATDTEAKVTEAQKPAGLNSATPQVKAIVKAKLQTSLYSMEKLKEQYESVTAGSTTLTPAEVKKALNNIVYGEAKEATPTPAGATMFKQATSNDQENNCKGAGAEHQAKSVAATMVCLCAKGTQTGVGHLCSAKQKGEGTAWNGQVASATTQFTDIFSHCITPASAELTSVALETALARVTAALTRETNNIYLGTFIKTKCDGSDSNGACVQYTGTAATDTEQFTKVPWVEKLQELTTNLRKAEKAKEAQQQLNRQAQQQLAAALSYSAEATLTLTQAQQSSPITAPIPAPNKASQEENEKERNKKGKDTDCKPPCKWDGEAKEPNKKCTLSEEAKKAVQKANQEKGGTDGKPASDLCTKHTKKEDCEKENEGQNPSEKPTAGGSKKSAKIQVF
uniref:Variant surface glycoprotein 1024 n=1 Tax=Trypanosoma brucei TaxID=5691 RepID=M4SZ54_9TRYP|nr:variant surface glycoprotein 1024 [Trypanosoma brucei]